MNSRCIRSILVALTVFACSVAIATAENDATPRPLGPDGGWISALAISPSFARDGDAWVAAFAGTIFRTDDAGRSWQRADVGINDPVVTSIAASPTFAVDRTVFATADQGVFVSSDAGQTWTFRGAGLSGHYCRAITFSSAYVEDHMAYVATDHGVYRSNDSGLSWTASADTRAVIALVETVSAARPHTLLAALDTGGIEASTDGGITWLADPGLPSRLRVLSIQPLSTGGVLAGTDDGLWLQRGDSEPWSQVGVPGVRIDALAVGSSTDVERVYAGSAGGSGVYASTDGGQTWTHAGSPADPFVTQLAASEQGSRTVIAGTAGGGVALSGDYGATWTPSNTGLSAFAQSSTSIVDGHLAIAGSGGAYLRDTNDSTWRSLPVPSFFPTSVVERSGTIYVGTRDAGLLRSDDAGDSWQSVAVPESSIGAEGVSPDGSTMLVAAGYVYRSPSATSPFERVNGLAGDDVRAFVFSSRFDADGIVYAATVNHGVYVSTDSGVTWKSASSGLPGAPVMSLVASPPASDTQTLYAATAGKGIYISTNGGASWTTLSLEPPDQVVDALAWSPDGDLLAGTEHGVFRLGAAGWRNEFPAWNDYVTTLTGLTSNGIQHLYIGTAGDGVWESDGPAVSPLSSPSATASPTANATASPGGQPIATYTVTVPTPVAAISPQPRTRVPSLRVNAIPFPVVQNRQALLTVRGPSGSLVVVHLRALRWRRDYSTFLDKHGHAALGFVAPYTQITCTAKSRLNGTYLSTRLVIPVVTP